MIYFVFQGLSENDVVVHVSLIAESQRYVKHRPLDRLL